MRVRCFFYVWIALMSLLTACDRGKTSSSIKENHPTVDFPKDASKLLKVGIQTQPTSLDPRKMEEISQEPLFRLLFEGLTTLGKEGTLIKALAKEITPSNNYRTYTFTLREAFWSDGSLVTANDFLEAWTEALDPNFTCPKVKDFFVIDRAREVKEGSISADQLGVFASDDNTLIVHLNKSIPYFPKLVASPVFFPISSRRAVSFNNSYATKTELVSNGPFILHSLDEVELLAKKNSFYWDREQVKLDGVKFLTVSDKRALEEFENGNLDWVNLSGYQQMQQYLAQGSEIVTKPNGKIHWFMFNLDKKPFNEIMVRKAFSFSLDRESMLEELQRDNITAAQTPLPIGASSEDSIELNMDESIEISQRFLVKGLEQLDMTKEEMPTIKLIYPNDPLEEQLAKIAKRQWENSFNISILLEPVPPELYNERLSTEDYHLASSGLAGTTPDPMAFLDSISFHEDSLELGPLRWNDEKFVTLLEKAKEIKEEDQKKIFLELAESLFVDEVPVIPLYFNVNSYVKKSHVKNVSISDLGQVDFKFTSIE